MADSAAVARLLVAKRAAREVVPSDPELSARWHRHGVPSSLSRWNYHPEYEIHLITQGTGWFVVGDCIDIFAAGQLVLVGSNVPHHWISDLEPGERLTERDVVFQFHPDWLSSCGQELPELGRLKPLLHQARRGIEFSGSTRSLAGAHLQAIGETAGATRLGHIFALLGVLADGPFQDGRLLGGEWPIVHGFYPGDDAADRIDLVYAYIFDHLADAELRLVGAARHVGMSTSAFSRYFRRVSGLTFSETVRRVRLAQAGKLLRDTALPVAAIAPRVGYGNLSNFNRQFRTQHGHTPREHRAREQQSTTERLRAR